MKQVASRRRSKRQIQADKEAEEAKQADIADKMARFEQMEQQIQQLQQQAKSADIIQKTINELHGFGLIQPNENNQLLPVQSFEEHQHLLGLR